MSVSSGLGHIIIVSGRGRLGYGHHSIAITDTGAQGRIDICFSTYIPNVISIIHVPLRTHNLLSLVSLKRITFVLH